MSSDFYRQFETPLDRAVYRAIEEENQRFLADPEAQKRAEEDGERWRHIRAAEHAAGPHAIVLPIATAQSILALLRGDESNLLASIEGAVERAVEHALRKAEERA